MAQLHALMCNEGVSKSRVNDGADLFATLHDADYRFICKAGLNMSYVEYKFQKAMHSLSSACGAEREWLASSHVHHLTRLREEELPEEVRTEFFKFTADISRLQTEYGGGSLHTAAAAMTEADVARLVERIVSLLNTCRARHTNSPQPSACRPLSPAHDY